MGGLVLLAVALVLLGIVVGLWLAREGQQPPRREREEVRRRLQGEE